MALKDKTGNVLMEVGVERMRQDDTWGEQNHTPEFWYAILGEEFGEVGKAIQDAKKVNWGEYRAELVQVAAVAVAMIESLDRRQERDYVGPN